MRFQRCGYREMPEKKSCPQAIHFVHATADQNSRQPDCTAGHAGHRRDWPLAREADGYCGGHRAGCGQGCRAGAEDARRTAHCAFRRGDGDAGGDARIAVFRRSGAAGGTGQLPLPATRPGGPADYRHQRTQGSSRQRCGPGVDGAGGSPPVAGGRG